MRVWKKKLTAALLLSLTLVMSSTSFSAAAVSAAAKTGWEKTSTGYVYYEKGKIVKNTLKKISGKYYYLGSDGVRKTGWYTVKTTKSGKTVYKAMKFKSNGQYTGTSKTISSNLMKKADKAISGQKLSASLTTAAQQKAALKKLFNYTKKTYSYGRVMGAFSKSKALSYAEQLLSTKKGNCYCYASGFAVLAKRATGLPVRVCWGTSNVLNKSRWSNHAWTEIQIDGTWYVYDTNAAKYSQRKDVKTSELKVSASKKYYKKTASVDINL